MRTAGPPSRTVGRDARGGVSTALRFSSEPPQGGRPIPSYVGCLTTRRRTDTMQTLDQSRVEAFAGQLAGEIGAALNAALVTVGDQLGLYRAMAGAGPVSAGELAARTETHERYVREWLNAQAAGGFVSYDSDDDCYTLP